jgi:hypothetical protein
MHGFPVQNLGLMVRDGAMRLLTMRVALFRQLKGLILASIAIAMRLEA